MDDTDRLAHLTTEGRRLIEAARHDWVASVPGLEWTVRDVVVHTGAVHRWCADLVRRALATNETGGSRAFHPSALTDAELPGWYAEGLDRLAETLAAAPADLACYTFLDDVSPRTFWRRRQLHETAVHRLDVEAAVGAGTDVSAALARDGLAELVGGFAREQPFAADRPATLLLRAIDGPSWLVRFGGPANLTEPVAAEQAPAADTTVEGTSAELYRFAWNRPATVTVDGDRAVLALWRKVRIR